MGSERGGHAYALLLSPGVVPFDCSSLAIARCSTSPISRELVSRNEINGVNVFAFIRAIAWCKEPAIQRALDDIANRTNDLEIKKLLALR